MRILLGLGALTAVLLVPAHATGQSTVQQLRIVAPAAPGGGWDQTARVMQHVLQHTGRVRIAPVENIPGAAGTIGRARFIGTERGKGDAVMISGLIMLGAIVTHRSPVTLRDVTPIARLTREYEVIAVPASSSFQSLADFIEAFRRRPEAISWGGGSAGGGDQILAGLVAAAVGVPASRVNYVAFSGGAMTEKRLSRRPDEFGRGAIEGVAGPEAANNAAAAGVLVPLLTLGLPSSATAAVLLAAFSTIRPSRLYLVWYSDRSPSSSFAGPSPSATAISLCSSGGRYPSRYLRWLSPYWRDHRFCAASPRLACKARTMLAIAYMFCRIP